VSIDFWEQFDNGGVSAELSEDPNAAHVVKASNSLGALALENESTVL
jgi:hypothetical protein